MAYFRKIIPIAALAFTLASPMQALAGDSPNHIVELFTSQGCSSCPPSNDLITKWSKNEDVLALTYSVEYWDYLGWKDTFADKSFSARQRAYAAALGHGRVYTPQIVLNGRVDKARFADRDVMRHGLSGVRPEILIGKDTVSISAFSDMDSPATVRLIRYTQGTQRVAVRRGENGGRTLPLTNVVTGMRDLGNYTGEPSEYVLGELASDEAFAILIQSDDFGPMIAAKAFSAPKS